MNSFSRICLVTMTVPLGLLAQALSAQSPREVLSSLEPFKACRFDFPPTSAKFVRLDVVGAEGQPCIDELEVYGPASVTD